MEAIAFPDGALFTVASVEVLGRDTSQHIKRATDQHGKPIALHVQREEFELRLIMPIAEVPLHTAGTLTVGELVLSTTVTVITPSSSGIVAHAVGVHESVSFPKA